MSDRKTLRLLDERMKELAGLPPQELGFLTTPFKTTAFYLKNYSLIIFMALTLSLLLLLQVLFGRHLVELTSILQQAF